MIDYFTEGLPFAKKRLRLIAMFIPHRPGQWSHAHVGGQCTQLLQGCSAQAIADLWLWRLSDCSRLLQNTSESHAAYWLQGVAKWGQSVSTQPARRPAAVPRHIVSQIPQREHQLLSGKERRQTKGIQSPQKELRYDRSKAKKPTWSQWQKENRSNREVTAIDACRSTCGLEWAARIQSSRPLFPPWLRIIPRYGSRSAVFDIPRHNIVSYWYL